MEGDLLVKGRDVRPDLNVAALQRRFRLPSPRSVYERVRRGTLPAPSYRLGKTLMWWHEDVEMLLEAMTK